MRIVAGSSTPISVISKSTGTRKSRPYTQAAYRASLAPWTWTRSGRSPRASRWQNVRSANVGDHSRRRHRESARPGRSHRRRRIDTPSRRSSRGASWPRTAATTATSVPRRTSSLASSSSCTPWPEKYGRNRWITITTCRPRRSRGFADWLSSIFAPSVLGVRPSHADRVTDPKGKHRVRSRGTLSAVFRGILRMRGAGDRRTEERTMARTDS